MRLEHMSENDMVKLSRKGLLDGYKTSKMKFLSIVSLRNRKEFRFAR